MAAGSGKVWGVHQVRESSFQCPHVFGNRENPPFFFSLPLLFFPLSPDVSCLLSMLAASLLRVAPLWSRSPFAHFPKVPPLANMALVFDDKKFQYILRILNTNVNGKEKVMYALTKIKGIGRRFANLVCKKADIDMNKRYA